MRLPLFLLVFAAVVSTAALGEDDCRCWTPSADIIAAVEANIARRPLPRGLDQYARYYAGRVALGRRGEPFIQISLVPPGGDHLPGIHIVKGRMSLPQGECAGRANPEGGKSSLRCLHFGGWTPDPEEIAAMETKMEGHLMPLGSLDRYARYYVGVIDSFDAISGGEDRTISERTIRGRLVSAEGNDLPGVHVVEGRMPFLAGEGCVTRFDAGRGQLTSFHCARPGAWTPTDAQVADLEDLLRHHGGPRLEQYGRHYSGISEGGRPLIRGAFVIELNDLPGIYIHSEAESPMMSDGGCAFVAVTYDPSSKATTWRCNGPHLHGLIDQGTYDPLNDKTTYKCFVVRSLARDSCTLSPSFRAPDSGTVDTQFNPPQWRPSEDGIH